MEYVNQGKLRKLRMRVETDNQFIPGAKKLKVRGRELDELPVELFSITELEILDLSPERQSCIYYRLVDIPNALGRLLNLRILMLDTNKIIEIPPVIGLLVNLERISLSNNSLTSFPGEFANLKKLTSLHAANNAFETFPRVVCELECLTFIDFCDNRIHEIPETISKLQKLESLLMYLNELTSLPDGVCELTELRTLWVGDNKLVRLPRNIGKLELLDWGNGHTISCVIDGNPLRHPPMSMCKQGILSIANYFDVTEPQ